VANDAVGMQMYHKPWTRCTSDRYTSHRSGPQLEGGNCPRKFWKRV